jgi:hypothetical protein
MKTVSKKVLMCVAFSLSMLGGVPYVQADAPDCLLAVQQGAKISGVITDSEGPIIGASVVEKGTSNGTITDLDGRFSLDVKPGAILVVSYVGYASQEVKATTGTMRITLKEDNQVLDEVVVTALGIKRERKALGYGVAEVKGESLTKAKETNVINSDISLLLTV